MGKKEEIRSGFKVTNNRKKVRAVELGILEELKKICKKHNIKYFASGGTMLGAIRHRGYIPRDDDIDLIMFRDDYENFIKIAKKELPSNIKIWEYYRGFCKLVDINTTALGNEKWRNEDFLGGIRIDIFPVDYASKYKIINYSKSKILDILQLILYMQKSNRNTVRKDKLLSFFISLTKFFCKIFNINYEKVRNVYKRLCQKVYFKGNLIYSAFNTYKLIPQSIFNKSHDMKFENTDICVPDGYDDYLKDAYGDYMEPVIWEGGHKCRYSVNKSYKDIIKTFDRSKSNEENYNSCNDLFLL